MYGKKVLSLIDKATLLNMEKLSGDKSLEEMREQIIADSYQLEYGEFLMLAVELALTIDKNAGE